MSRRDESAPPDAAMTVVEHVCVPPKWMTRALLAMAATLLACLAAIGVGAVYLHQQQLYIEGRGEYRDAEAKRVAEQNRASWCTALDTFPQGIPSLDRLRALYRCGPGLPLSKLTPEERERLGNRPPAPVIPSPAPSAPSPFVAPPLGSGAVPTVPEDRTPPAPQRPSMPPGPTPSTTPPLVDLNPVTKPLCDALGVCL